MALDYKLNLHQRGRVVVTRASEMLPEWQVFVRRPNGLARHFVLRRRHQALLLAGVALLAAWAGCATWRLSLRPTEIAEHEHRLDVAADSFRTSEARLAAAQKMIDDATRALDGVDANLLVLAETNAALARDRAPAGTVVPLADVHDPAAPPADEQTPGAAQERMAREQVRRLELALDRLKATYSGAVQSATDVANQRVSETEQMLTRLGVNVAAMEKSPHADAGQGGPFVPLPVSSVLGNTGLDHLVRQMDRWDDLKRSLQYVPLAQPLHMDWEMNSPFGARQDPLNERTGIHEGIDMGAPYGSPIYATASGVVTVAGPHENYGLLVEIDHGNGLSTRYAHLSRIKVEVGQQVTRATVIGLLGNTGRTTGAHLHYEVRVADVPRDPLKFLSAGRDAPKVR